MNLRITFILTLLSCTLLAQNSTKTASISGTVFNKEDQPLEFANVILFAVSDSSMVKGAATNSEGQFKIEQVKDGNYWLSAQYVGLSNVDLPAFEIKNGNSKSDVAILFGEVPLELSEVEVVASRPLIEVKPDRTVFNVDGSINATGNTALELLRKSPGVVVDNNDNIILAGKQGVAIYIDDKPSYLSGDELAAFLQNVQSSEIDAIEIISEPSAKYDAEGNAGIINIKMKKNANLGANTSLNLGYSYGKNHKYNGGLNTNYRNKSLNLFGNFNYKDTRNENWIDFLRYQSGEVFDSETINFYDSNNYNYKVGADYFINKQNTIGIIVNGYNADGIYESNSTTNISGAVDLPIKEVLVSSSFSDNYTNNLNANLNYQHKNESNATLNIDVDYGNFKSTSDNNLGNDYKIDSKESNYSSDTSTDINIYTTKADYEKEVLYGKLGAGVKFSYVVTNNAYNFYKLFEDVPQLDTGRSSVFNFKENINAAYVNYTRKVESYRVSANIGLRLEQTNNTAIEKGYLDVFPTAGITYEYKPTHQFKINYNKRIKRPRYQDLNPFEFILSELSYVIGNVNLRPQYAHNFSLSHTYKYTLTTTLSYTYIKDYFDYLSDTIDINKSFLQPINLDNQQVINLGVSYPFSPKNWWNTYTSLNAYHKMNNADFGENRLIELAINSVNIYHQSTFLLPFDISLELSGYYNSPSVWGALYQTKANYSFDTGLKKKLFKGKGNLKIAYTDIFNTGPWSAIQEFSGSKTEGMGGWESQRIQLNFTYLFGNEQVKDIRKRKTGLESEAGRIKQ